MFPYSTEQNSTESPVVQAGQPVRFDRCEHEGECPGELQWCGSGFVLSQGDAQPAVVGSPASSGAFPVISDPVTEEFQLSYLELLLELLERQGENTGSRSLSL